MLGRDCGGARRDEKLGWRVKGESEGLTMLCDKPD